MTTENNILLSNSCPAEETLKLLSGKWKPQILRLASDGPLRFNTLVRQIEGANKQGIAVALKDLEAGGLLTKNIINAKPLHIEYLLSEKGKSVMPVFVFLSNLQKEAVKKLEPLKL